MMEVKLLLLLLALFTILSDACYPGIESIGTTSPLGDIIQSVGSNITINCILVDHDIEKGNSSYIRWRINGTDVSSEKIRVLDERTAQLYIPNASFEDTGYYSCYLGFVEDDPQTICNNDVKIGEHPATGIPISCMARNWENLTCTWSPPFNPIPTKWSLIYRMSRFRIECPQYINMRHGCFFSDQTSPAYRQAAPIYYFYLEGSNPLGKSKTEYKFEHYEQVLPNPPINLKVLEVDSQHLEVKWEPPVSMKYFPPSLYFNLSYQSEWNQTWQSIGVGLNVTKIVLQDLIPYSNYTIKVICRSGLSTKSPWSEPAIAWKRTPPDVPGASPNISASNFQQKKFINTRELTLYWKNIPKHLEYGNKVYFLIDAIEDNLQRNVTVEDLTGNFARITNLDLEKSYIFRIRAYNEKGLSPIISYLSIPRASQMPPVPDYVNTIAYDPGIFEISWKYSEKLNGGIPDNVTVFWCEMLSARKGHCFDTDINWTILPGQNVAWNFSLSNNISYEFAVAANYQQGSSGMVWSSCIVPYNGVVGKMRSVSVNHVSAHELQVTWRLDCSEKTGILEGFSIYLCVFDNKECKENSTFQEFVPDPHAVHYTISNLIPFTLYKVTVSAVTRAGEGEQSDPLYNRTTEGAPEDPCQLIISEITNTSVTADVVLPTQPNGNIRHVKFLVNGRSWDHEELTDSKYTLNHLNSFTNYSIEVVACTLKEFCSPPSLPQNITTDIGVPSSPTITQIMLFNMTHMQVSWDEPAYPNGPISSWIISLVWTEGEEHEIKHREFSFADIGSRTHYIQLPFACTEEVGDIAVETAYNITIYMKNKNNEGLPSKTYSTIPCKLNGVEGISLWLICIILVGGMVGFFSIITLGICAVRRIKDTVLEIKNIKVQLPKGLDSPDVTSLNSYSGYKGSNTHNPYEAINGHVHPMYGRLNSSESQASAMTDPRFSTSSIDELLYNRKHNGIEKYRRNLSGDSSGCSSGHESISSSLTTRTQLSSDSGAETDIQPPPSPDSVFTEPTWKSASGHSTLRFHSPCLPKVDESTALNKMDKNNEDIPPPHYAKLGNCIVPSGEIKSSSLYAKKVIEECKGCATNESYLQPIPVADACFAPESTISVFPHKHASYTLTKSQSEELDPNTNGKEIEQYIKLNLKGTVDKSKSLDSLRKDVGAIKDVGYSRVGIKDVPILENYWKTINESTSTFSHPVLRKMVAYKPSSVNQAYDASTQNPKKIVFSSNKQQHNSLQPTYSQVGQASLQNGIPNVTCNSLNLENSKADAEYSEVSCNHNSLSTSQPVKQSGYVALNSIEGDLRSYNETKETQSTPEPKGYVSCNNVPSIQMKSWTGPHAVSNSGYITNLDVWSELSEAKKLSSDLNSHLPAKPTTDQNYIGTERLSWQLPSKKKSLPQIKLLGTLPVTIDSPKTKF